MKLRSLIGPVGRPITACVLAAAGCWWVATADTRRSDDESERLLTNAVDATAAGIVGPARLEALRVLERFAWSGQPSAQFQLAWTLAPLAVDEAAAMELVAWCDVAARAGNPYADRLAAQILAQHCAHPVRGVKRLTDSARSGNAISQAELGWWYREGHHVPRDPVAAREWATSAARSGEASGRYLLAMIELDAGGDRTNAVALVKQAADDGLAEAQVWLFQARWRGEEVGLSAEEAFALCQAAADAHHIDALAYVAWSLFKGIGKRLDEEAALATAKLAATRGSTIGMVNLAFMLDQEGVAQDRPAAFAWNLKAADAGNAFAQYLIGNAYFYGDGVPRDRAKSIAWYERASAQDQPEAISHLAWCYDHGRGVPLDHAKAEKLFARAAELGSEDAKDALAGYPDMKARAEERERAEEAEARALDAILP